MEQSTHTEQKDLARRLAAYLVDAGHASEVTDLTPLKLGWESRVFALDVANAAVPKQILRLYYGVDGGVTALREYRGLLLLRELGYPVPQAILVEPSAHPLGSPFLMMHRAAGTSPRACVFAQAAEDDRDFVRVFCELLAQLHTLAWHDVAHANSVESIPIDEHLATWHRFDRQFSTDDPHPALAWLAQHRAAVAELPLALVHWDFHHENMLMDADGNATVIDWTQVQATDARFDLAWTLTLVRSYAGAQAAEGVRAGYHSALPSGHALRDLQDIAWFEAAACAKRLLSVTIALAHGAGALGMRPGAEAEIVMGLPALANVYRRWLELTDVPLPDVAARLADHL